MSKNEKKVPGALIAIVAVIVAVAVFIPVVYMPYKNKKPTMDADHEAALAELQLYEDSIANQANIEKDIEEMTAEWDEFQKTMFVDATSSLQDIVDACNELGIEFSNFSRSDQTPDPSGAYSSTGSPLYYVTLTMNMETDRDTLLDLLNFIEVESIGCYYVSTLGISTKEDDVLSVNMTVYLYYYNQDITVQIEEEDTDGEAADEAAEE